MTKSITGRTASFLLRELVGEVLFFPVWWYSQGLRLAWRRLLHRWIRLYDRVGLRYLLTNMGKPMYGDYSRSGKIISFFFRLILVGWSLVVMVVGGSIAAAVFVLWVLAPAVIMALLIRQLIPVDLYA